MTMGLNSSAKCSKDSATNSECKVCHQRCAIQLLMVLQKLLTIQSANFSRNSSQKVNETGMKNLVCLWSYRTTVRIPMNDTPFSLVYECEVVHPLETQIPSLSIALMIEMMHEDKRRLHFQELEALDDKWLQAQHQIELYQARIAKDFNKKVKEQIFRKVDLVLATRRPIVTTHKTKGKFKFKWEGPFVIEIVNLNGACHLINPNGDTLIMPTNVKYLKKYYLLSDLTSHLWSKKYSSASC